MLPALLLLNGDAKSPRKIKQLAAMAAIIIAADGGTRHLKRLGITPHLVIGDMDSLPESLPKWKDTAYVCDRDENRSDFEKALDYLKDIGAGPVWVAGATGGRLDHALVNFSLIERYAAKMPLAVIDQGHAQIAGKGRHEFTCAKGDAVTLLPATGACRVTTQGLKYSLKNEALKKGSRGLSNRATGRKIKLRITSGRLWVLISTGGTTA